MRIVIFGVGAVGGYFGAVLARAGYWVGLIARGQRLAAIREAGLRIESPKGDFTVTPAHVTDDPGEIGAVDAVILSVKAWQVPEAARGIRPLLAAGTKVLPLQNGVEAPDQLKAVLGSQHHLIGLCRILASVVAPGCVRHLGIEPTVVMGEPDGSRLSHNVQALADALVAAGVVVETPSNIHGALWEKLVLIAAVSGTGAVTRSPVGEVRACQQTRDLLRQLMEEVAAVAKGRGVQLDGDVVRRTLSFVDAMPANATASMQRDIAEGRPSEVEAIIGAVVRFGNRAGVPTPALDYVYASLLPQESRARRVAATEPA